MVQLLHQGGLNNMCSHISLAHFLDNPGPQEYTRQSLGDLLHTEEVAGARDKPHAFHETRIRLRGWLYGARAMQVDLPDEIDRGTSEVLSSMGRAQDVAMTMEWLNDNGFENIAKILDKVHQDCMEGALPGVEALLVKLKEVYAKWCEGILKDSQGEEVERKE